MKHNSDTAALNDLLSTLNNPDIVGVTPVDQRDEVDKALPGGPHPGPKIETTPLLKEAWVAPFQKPTPPANKAVILSAGPFVGPRKLFFTGRTNVGKDYAAAAVGATIFGFADPIYAIASYCFNTTVSATIGKDLPGMREFLQTVGQWGRNVVNAQYPLTAPRALFTHFIRNQMPADYYGNSIDWKNYGRYPNLWLDCCIARANGHLEAAPPGTRVAITNCRFDNEFKRLTAEGFQHWHIMCGPATWAKRLLGAKLTPESPALKDISEQLAANLDSNVIKQLSAAKNGAKLRCLWNDDVAPLPSPRLHSLTTFLQSIKGA